MREDPAQETPPLTNMNTPTSFNFRTINDRLGIPITNHNSWTIGRALQRFAASRGIEPDRILTKKTDPNPSVKAPHCIAHYPIEILDDAIAHIDEIWKNNDDSTQLQFEL
jgi:hypothetical protein